MQLAISTGSFDLLAFLFNLDLFKILNQVLQRFKDKQVTLNKSKCVFNVKQVEFLGHHISPDGVRPLTSKISAITDYPTPTNLTELRRFMSMAQQLSKFTDQLATAAKPLRDLLSSKTVWTWTIEHEKSFKEVKEIVINYTILHLYDINRPTKLRVDGSKIHGISAILYQKHDQGWFPVFCASVFCLIMKRTITHLKLKCLVSVGDARI